MKKRRITMIALLLIAALALGIGYAAYTVNMKIAGLATVGAPAPNVKFKAVSGNVLEGSVHSSNSYGTAAVGAQTIDLNLEGFADAEDSVKVTYTVHNGHDFDVKLSDITYALTNTGTNYPSHFSIVIDNITNLTSEKVLAAGDDATFDVTITLAKTFATDASVVQNFEISFTATGVVPNT